MKAVVKILGSIASAEGHRPDDVFDDFAEMSACACAAGTREAEYLAVVSRYRKESSPRLMAEAFGELVVAMEAEPFRDLLGPIYMDLSPNTFSGEFYTPRDVCRMMAQMIVGNGELPEERPIRILEPAIGAGAMVLAAAEAFHARGVLPTELYVEGWDVSRTAVHMSYVNATLSSLPAKVILGNTLSGEVRKVWRTIHLPVYRSAETSSEEPEGRQNENRPVLPPPQLSLEL